LSADPQRDAVLLAHMREAIARINRYTQRSRERFMTDSLVQDGVARNLHTLTESSQRLSEPTKQLEPSVPWAALSGFRNVVVHGYLGLDLEVLWSVVERELPLLDQALARLSLRD
jgi:uncharacterized protein with HEPN domain